MLRQKSHQLGLPFQKRPTFVYEVHTQIHAIKSTETTRG